MATLERFEELDSWKKARELSRRIYQVSSMGELARDFGLRDQLRRAAVSIMSNIAEGFERDGNKEFRHFLSLAKASAGEVRSQLYVALDAQFINQDDFSQLSRMTNEAANLIGGLIRYLNSSEIKGRKFKCP